MDPGQKISASAFTHRGQSCDTNTNNFILDGRHLFEFEINNSQVSVTKKAEGFFFALCDTKPGETLNRSVSGIKELRKLNNQYNSGSFDIRSKTDSLGECFVNTEKLLYDSLSFDGNTGLGKKKSLASLDKKLVSFSGKDINTDPDDPDYEDIRTDTNFDSKFEYSEGRQQEDYRQTLYQDDDDFDEDDEESEVEMDPGEKGFSAVGFVLSEKKGSILAQGDCDAFLLRGAELRSISGTPTDAAGEYAARAQAKRTTGNYHTDRFKMPFIYRGRKSEMFTPRDGDVYLLCTTSIVNALGEENLDEYLAIREDVSIISGAIIGDASRSDPDSNHTCMIIRIESPYEEAAAAQSISPIQVPRKSEARYATDVQERIARVTQPEPPSRQDPRMPPVKSTLQNRDTFTPRATSKFEPRQRRMQVPSTKSLVTSVITTLILLGILLSTYYIFTLNGQNSGNQANNPGRNTTTTPASSTTEPRRSEGDNDDDNDERDNGNEIAQSTTRATQPLTTTETTTPAPDVIHKVKSGDTLSKISEQYYSNARYVNLIKEANNLQSDNIRIGQELVIPPKPETTTSVSNEAAATTTRGAGTTAARRSIQ